MNQEQRYAETNAASGNDPNNAPARIANYLADCAERGASPYGANRHYRRAAASQRRHAAGEQRRLAHEQRVALTNKLRRAGICDMAFDVARFKRKSAAIDAITSNFALAT